MESLITLSDGMALYNKGNGRDIWSHGTNCTVSLDATPYSGVRKTNWTLVGHHNIYFFDWLGPI